MWELEARLLAGFHRSGISCGRFREGMPIIHRECDGEKGNGPLRLVEPHTCRIIYGMLSRALAAIVLVVSPSTAASYRFGEVWDGDRVQKNVCVSTQGNKIQSVGACPTDAI